MKLALGILALALLAGGGGFVAGKHQGQKVCVFDADASSPAGTCKLEGKTCTITLRYQVPQNMVPQQ
jgi:hypothetical protein